MIKGIHHVSMKCRPEQFDKVREFYCGLLELPVYAEWETGFLLDTPNGKVEIFWNGEEDLLKGTIRHFAFEVDDVELYAEKCRKAGYEVFMGPKDVVLGTVKAKVAFCSGPLGEDVEFFEEL